MKKELDNPNWEQAFGYAGELGQSNFAVPQPIIGFKGDLSPFNRESVETILAMYEYDDGDFDCMGAFILKDGRFAYLEVGCDYTGWDCQSSGSSWVTDSFDSLWSFGFTRDAKVRLADAQIVYLSKLP